MAEDERLVAALHVHHVACHFVEWYQGICTPLAPPAEAPLVTGCCTDVRVVLSSGFTFGFLAVLLLATFSSTCTGGCLEVALPGV